mmetsp:Transcript_6708/g.9276  ORF Transcript_6708/g.9276 Transcript_6708/m.9276 type:complete len:102 (+) Transcript_6708:142-447(+)
MVNLKELKKQQQDKKTTKTSFDDIDDDTSKPITQTNWNWGHFVSRAQIYFLQGVKRVGAVAWNFALFGALVIVPQLRVRMQYNGALMQNTVVLANGAPPQM